MLLLQYVRPLGCLFNQTSRFLFRRRLPRRVVAFGSCRGLTSVCSFFVSRRCRTSCVSSSYTLFSPPPLPTKARWSFFPHLRSLVSRARRPEPSAATVCSSLGMSFEPDIPICVSAPPPSSAKARRLLRSCKTSAYSFSISGRVCRIATADRTPSGTSVQPDASSCVPLSIIVFVGTLHCTP